MAEYENDSGTPCARCQKMRQVALDWAIAIGLGVLVAWLAVRGLS
jgi:uncharacterized membrane protein (DUF441 family)